MSTFPTSGISVDALVPASTLLMGPPSSERHWQQSVPLRTGKAGGVRWRGVACCCEARLVQAMEFEATVGRSGRDRIMVPVPFDPDGVWGVKPRHHVSGTVGG